MLTKIRIRPSGSVHLDIDIGDGWRPIGAFGAKNFIELSVAEVISSEIKESESLPTEISPEPPISSTVERRHWKIRFAKICRAIIALPGLPIPLLTLILSAILLTITSVLAAILPCKMLRTIANDVFMSQLNMCVAIEHAIVGD